VRGVGYNERRSTYPGADVRRELHGGVPGRQEDSEAGAQVDVLVSQGDQDPATSLPELLVQDRVVILDVLMMIEYLNSEQSVL
jgi:hypothetical protein